MAENGDDKLKEEKDAIPFAEFLESTPPSRLTRVSELVKVKPDDKKNTLLQKYSLRTPQIQLHCSHDSCNGTRFFRSFELKTQEIPIGYRYNTYTSYICSNCRKTRKTFSLEITIDRGMEVGECYKFGEIPAYGPPTPARLIKLIGPDREVFLKGRRCENQGLGIGAFVYYRRVVDNQKNRILDEIIKVSKKLSVPDDRIELLEKAKSETQFKKAVASVKDAIPESLLINGHNPLTLLYSALSDGLHDRGDEHCLELASSIRVILGELSERLAQALKDEAELDHAISKLLSVKDS